MNNRRNLKENLTISNKQRFSIRKFSIGVASVMLGTTLYFMGGVGTSIVHADSVQGQSVQTSNLDTNSAQASSDTSSAEQTSSQNQTSSAQNSQKAVSNASSNTESTDSKTQTSDQVDNATTDKNEASQADNATTDKNEASQADNASATNIKTRDNKKVVSDANRAKSTANDTQTKPAQQTAKSDAANSNTLVVQRTKKLTVNAKLLADSKAQTDTKTDSNYSVTDNYPKDLMTYLPSDFNNKQEYAFEWLQNENNNNIILTTNRTGDGVVYVYQDGEKVGTLAKKSSAKKSSCSLQDTIVDNWGYDHTIKIGTVYNDDYAGIVQSNNGYLLNIIYSSHAKDVDNAGSSYSTVSFFVPHKITQTVTYKDSDGTVIKGLTHTQDGLTGQSYTTGLPSGSDYVRKGEYLANITHNGSGLMSEFHDTYSCTKDYHDGVKVTFTENDSEKPGTMDYVIYDGGEPVRYGSLADGQSTDYTNSIGNYTIVNPYVQQTTNIVYQYEKLGNVVNTVPGPEGKTTTTTTPYTNDPDDPTTIEPIKVPSIPGYTTMVNGETVSDKTKPFWPADLSKNTTITYVADDQSTTAKFVDDDNNGAQVGKTITLSGKTDQTINTGLQVPANYELAKGQTLPATYTFKAENNSPIVIHLVHATKPDTNDNHLNKTVTRTINVTNPDGKTTTIKQEAHLHRSGTIDEVTQTATYTPWTTDNWAEYDTPQISGYTPSQAKVSATTVDGNTQDQTVTITYSADDQSTTAKFVDDDNNGAQVGKTITLSGKTDQTINTGLQVPANYELAKGQTLPATYTFKAENNSPIVIHLVHATKPDTNDNHLNKTVTRTINVTNPDGKTTTIKQEAHLHRSGTIDEVTQTATYTPWTTDNWAEYDTPQISGYTPSQAKVSATTVDGNTQDQTVTITYSADKQKASVTYMDDKTGKTLKVDNLNGVTNAKSGYTTKAAIDTYTGLGYTLVSDDTNGNEVVFDNDDANDQAFTVHLSHGTITVTPENPGKPGEPVDPDNPDGPKYPAGTDKTGLTDTINRTITYVMSDGSKAPEAVHDSLSYTASKVIDKVTGEVLETETKWSANQDFKDVDSPSVKGYTPDKKTVSNKNVAHDAADITETVKYNADAQKASVTYVDDKTGKTLKVDNLNGVTNAKSGYTTKAAIDTYTGLGYTLVSDDTNGKEVVFDNDDAVDQAFTVHLSHGTITVTPENPGKPGEPVDPDNPDGPKYPDGTDEYQVKRTGTQTIHYVGAGDKTPADNKQTFVFTREITFDDVTGKIISVTPWNVQSHTFGNVDTPVIPGYHADKAVAGGETVTPDDLNKVITVTYAPDGGSGDNPGSNGGGDQGTTPTPDDQPDTTLPSDSNTDKDVEKDKQDKPKKVKKARKIIKTRITKQEHIGNAEKAEPLAEQEHNDQTVASPVKNEANEPQLPQTGEANTSVIGLLGMLVAGFAAILGFESSRSRKHKN